MRLADVLGAGHRGSRLEWRLPNSDGETHTVAGKSSNAWGLYDMHGNVFEWCQDAYQEDISNETRDPCIKGDAESSRVVRGGSWGLNPHGCRSALRGDMVPGLRNSCIGFRVAVELR